MDQVEKELFEALYKDRAATEVRKEDDLYYQGAFWIFGESVREIKHGHFSIKGVKLPCNFTGDYYKDPGSKNSLTHKRLWAQFNKDFEDKPYNYFPRGRVAIYNGTAYIHLHSLFNQPDVIDTIIKEYSLQKLEIDIDLNDTYQGSHYEFLLK